MKKIIYILSIALFIILPSTVNAGIKTTTPCDERKSDGKNQIKTCYIDITVTDDTALYSVSGEFTMINTSLKGEIEAVDKRIKITNKHLTNLTFVSETAIKNETIRIAKFTIYLASNGQECKVQWKPEEYGRNYSCSIENGYFYDKNGNSVSELEYNKQCKPHSCEIVGDTYFDKNGNVVSKNEYSKQCEKHSCEIINGVYFDKNGNSVTDLEYDKQCNPHYCKIIDGTYFGKNGDIISKNEYNVQCPTSNPHTTTSETFGYILLGLLTTTFISIILCFKQNNKKIYKI